MSHHDVTTRSRRKERRGGKKDGPHGTLIQKKKNSINKPREGVIKPGKKLKSKGCEIHRRRGKKRELTAFLSSRKRVAPLPIRKRKRECFGRVETDRLQDKKREKNGGYRMFFLKKEGGRAVRRDAPLPRSNREEKRIVSLLRRGGEKKGYISSSIIVTKKGGCFRPVGTYVTGT